MRSSHFMRFILVPVMAALSFGVAFAQENLPGADFSGLTEKNHPRLLFTHEEFVALKKELKAGANHNVVRLHNLIIDAADMAVNDTSRLRFVKDAANKRILSVSSRAENRLIPCAYAYRMTGRKLYLKKAEKDLLDVCTFPSWNEKHFLDVAEMSTGVAIAYDWLYNELKASTKEIVLKALHDFALIQSRSDDKKIIWWYKTKNNWNSICNAGLVCAAVAVYEHHPELALSVIDDAVRYNKPAVGYMYGPDGGYPEGSSYWTYGTRYQIILNSVFERTFGTDFELGLQPGFMESATFKIFSKGPTGKHFNFADSGTGGTHLPELWYFASKKNDISIVKEQIELMQSKKYLSGIQRGFLPVALMYARTIEPLENIASPTLKFYAAQGHTPMMMCRSGWGPEDHYLGVKGGKDGYNHGHMDGGMFVYDAYGVRWAMDFVRQSYAPLEKGLAEFGKKLITPAQDSWRWKIFRLNCRQHNTLTVNDKDHNVNAIVPMVSTENTESRMSATFNLTPLFNGDLDTAVRTAAICADAYLEVKDELAAPAEKPAHVRWTMVTEAEPEVTTDGIILKKKGITMLLKAEGAKVNYMTWSSDPKDYDSPIKHLDSSNPGTYICGYVIDIPAGEKYTIVVTLKKK